MISGLSRLSTTSQSNSQCAQKYAHYFNKVTTNLMENFNKLFSRESAPLEKVFCFQQISSEAKYPEQFTMTIQDDKENTRSLFGTISSNKILTFKIENQELLRTSITTKEAQDIKLRTELNDVLSNSHPYVADILHFPGNSLFSPELKVNHIIPKK